MNNNIAVPNQGQWPIAHSAGRWWPGPGQRTYSAEQQARFPDARANYAPLALAGAGCSRRGSRRRDSRYAADQARLSRLGHARGQPAFGVRSATSNRVSRTRSDQQLRFRRDPGRLLGSKSVSLSGRRRNSTWQTIRTSCAGRGRFEAAPGGNQRRSRRASRSRPRTGQADQVQLQFDFAATGGNGRERHRRQLHQHLASAALRSLRLRPQFPRAADQQDPRRPRAVRARARRLCPATGHHQHRRQARTDGKHGEQTTRIRCRANPWSSSTAPLAAATARRVAAEGAYRQALGTGPTRDVDNSVLPLRQELATASGRISAKAEIHEAGASRDAEPAVADRRARQRRSRAKSARASSGQINGLLADYRAALSAERALQARVGRLKGDVLNLRGRSIQYNILQREVDTNRSLYDALLQRYKEIGVAGGVGMAPVSDRRSRRAPDVPVQAEPVHEPADGLRPGPARRHRRRGRPRIRQ